MLCVQVREKEHDYSGAGYQLLKIFPDHVMASHNDQQGHCYLWNNNINFFPTCFITTVTENHITHTSIPCSLVRDLFVLSCQLKTAQTDQAPGYVLCASEKDTQVPGCLCYLVSTH